MGAKLRSRRKHRGIRPKIEPSFRRQGSGSFHRMFPRSLAIRGDLEQKPCIRPESTNQFRRTESQFNEGLRQIRAGENHCPVPSGHTGTRKGCVGAARFALDRRPPPIYRNSYGLWSSRVYELTFRVYDLRTEETVASGLQVSQGFRWVPSEYHWDPGVVMRSI